MTSCLDTLGTAKFKERKIFKSKYLFTRRRHTGGDFLAQCYSKQREARQVEEVSHHLGKQPLTVASTSVGLRVSAPRTRKKLLKTTIYLLQRVGRMALGETSTDSDPISVGLRV